MITWKLEGGRMGSQTSDRMRDIYCAAMSCKRPLPTSNLACHLNLDSSSSNNNSSSSSNSNSGGGSMSSSSSNRKMARNTICCSVLKQKLFRQKQPKDSASDHQGQIHNDSIPVTMDHAATIPLILHPQVLAARHTLIGCARHQEKRPIAQAAWTSGSMVLGIRISTSCVQSQRIPPHFQLRFAYSPTSTRRRKSLI